MCSGRLRGACAVAFLVAMLLLGLGSWWRRDWCVERNKDWLVQYYFSDLAMQKASIAMQKASLWGPLVSLPYAIMTAWCIWQGARFQRTALHRWTQAYGVLAGFLGVCFVTRRCSLVCRYSAQWEGVNIVVMCAIMSLLLVAKIVSLVLIGHKLRQLAYARLSRVVVACTVVVQLAIPALFIAIVIDVEGAHWLQLMLLAGLVYALGGVLGVYGLTASAARTVCSVSAQHRRAGAFVLLTAASLVLSSISTAAVVFYSFVVENANFTHWAVFVDGTFDCLSVALFSGLVGPTSLRDVAQEAFAKISAYNADQLQEFYRLYLNYLDRAQVKWIKYSYLRSLAERGEIMTICQKVPADAAVMGSRGLPHSRDEHKPKFVLSHPWLSKEHPDPAGTKLGMLVDQMELLGAEDDDSVFIDYMSLPQNDKQHPDLLHLELHEMPKPGEHPAMRTTEEQEQFKVALSAMEQMYSTSGIRVIVLPMEEALAADRAYISRGWCLLEFCLALNFENIANASIHPPVERLVGKIKAVRGDTKDGFRKAFEKTSFTCKGDKRTVLQLFNNTLSMRASGNDADSAPNAQADTGVGNP